MLSLVEAETYKCAARSSASSCGCESQPRKRAADRRRRLLQGAGLGAVPSDPKFEAAPLLGVEAQERPHQGRDVVQRIEPAGAQDDDRCRGTLWNRREARRFDAERHRENAIGGKAEAGDRLGQHRGVGCDRIAVRQDVTGAPAMQR